MKNYLLIDWKNFKIILIYFKEMEIKYILEDILWKIVHSDPRHLSSIGFLFLPVYYRITVISLTVLK